MPGPYRYLATATQTWKKEFTEEDFKTYFSDNEIEPEDGSDYSDDQFNEAVDRMKEEYQDSIGDDPSLIPDNSALDVTLERLWPSDEGEAK